MPKLNRNPRSFTIHRFDTRDDAVAAIERFHGITLPGGTAPLQVRFSDSPAQKKLKIQVAAKRKVMKPGPPGYAVRRRSDVEEQYVYAASDYYQMQGMAVPAYPQMAVAMPPEMVAGGPLPVYWTPQVPVMPMPQMTPVIPVRTSPPNGRENRPPSSSAGTPPELSESGQLRVDPRGGMLRVPRSPSDLGNSAEISAASEDGAFEFGSAGDIDELTQRVNSLMYENSIGSDETVEGPSKGKETRKDEGVSFGFCFRLCWTWRARFSDFDLVFSFSLKRWRLWRASRRSRACVFSWAAWEFPSFFLGQKYQPYLVQFSTLRIHWQCS